MNEIAAVNRFTDIIKHINKYGVNSDSSIPKIPIFDYYFSVQSNYREYELYHFLEKKELIISITCMMKLNNLFLKSFHNEHDLFEMFITNPSIKKYNYYKTILHRHMNHSLRNLMTKRVFLILTISEYDMNIDISNCDHPLDIILQHDNFIRKNKILDDLIEQIVNHNSFRLKNNHILFLEQNKSNESTEQIKSIIRKHHHEKSPTRLYLLIIGHCDDYLEINNNRFFNITKQLPMDIQMIIANTVYGFNKSFISSKNVDKNIDIIGYP